MCKFFKKHILRHCVLISARPDGDLFCQYRPGLAPGLIPLKFMPCEWRRPQRGKNQNPKSTWDLQPALYLIPFKLMPFRWTCNGIIPLKLRPFRWGRPKQLDSKPNTISNMIYHKKYITLRNLLLPQYGGITIHFIHIKLCVSNFGRI